MAGVIRQAAQAQEDAIAYLNGHADASHWGVVEVSCLRCVALAAACGVTLQRSGCEAHGITRCPYC